MLPCKLFGFELVEKLVHLVWVDARLKTLDEGADLERRRRHRLLCQPETDPQGFVHRGLQSFPAASDRTFEALGNIGVESKSRTHEDIMMSSQG